MLLRGIRRSQTKFLLLGLIIICFIFYFKVYVNESVNSNSLVSPGSESYIKFENLIQADLLKQSKTLGFEGIAATLKKTSEIEISEKQLATIALNEELSEHLSYNRTVPDARNPLCHDLTYNLDELATTSVVIIFFNEPYSVLLRTVHSVINTCDKKILKEVIMVDDGSTNVELKDKMDYYISTRLPKGMVKVIRLKNRLGLIRARLAGARLAKGDVLLFLDAHCECVRNWLEPLLERIKESPTSVLVPIIDVIDAKDFHYSINGYKHFQVGGFTWNGHFDWINIPKRERERQRVECPGRNPEICPTYSPTMAGGLFAIDRNYFWEIGSYDEQMDGWGGENLEMSFRIWQCGGTIETIPCSRVGHIFRDFHPYSFPDNRDTHGINTVRMAMVWMDDYINLFYMNRPDLKNNPDVGDVTHRRVLREKLKCKSFDWFMRNIYPEKFIPTKGVQAYGRISAKSDNLCFDDLQQPEDNPYNIGIYVCHKPQIAKSQFYSFTNDGVIRNENSCATVQKTTSNRRLIVMITCNTNDSRNDKWILNDDEQLKHVGSGLCVDHKELTSGDNIYVTKCSSGIESQKWEIVH